MARSDPNPRLTHVVDAAVVISSLRKPDLDHVEPAEQRFKAGFSKPRAFDLTRTCCVRRTMPLQMALHSLLADGWPENIGRVERLIRSRDELP